MHIAHDALIALAFGRLLLFGAVQCGSGKEKEHKYQPFDSRDSPMGWGSSMSRGGGQKSCYLKTQGKQKYALGYPGYFPGSPGELGVLQKAYAKRTLCLFFGPLVFVVVAQSSV